MDNLQEVIRCGKSYSKRPSRHTQGKDVKKNGKILANNLSKYKLMYPELPTNSWHSTKQLPWLQDA